MLSLRQIYSILHCPIGFLSKPRRVYAAAISTKINALRPIFRQLQADIIGCQEIWDEQALIDLCRAAGLNDYHVTVPLASNQPDSPLTQGRGAIGTPERRFGIAF